MTLNDKVAAVFLQMGDSLLLLVGKSNKACNAGRELVEQLLADKNADLEV